jgi:hypothetical protein
MPSKPHYAVIAALISVPMLSACKPGITLSKAAFIVGPTNDIVQLDTATKHLGIEQVANASVLIATSLPTGRKKFCSGTVIVDPLSDKAGILTNHHCFAEVDSKNNVLPNWIPEACTETVVYFGFRQGQSESTRMLRCKPGSLRSDMDGDLAFFQLLEEIPEPYLPLAMWDKGLVPSNKPAMIVHFPDIEEHHIRLQGSRNRLPSAALTLDNCIVEGAFKQSDWKHDRSLPFALRHTCDLLKGSSGSALVDRETHKVLGVNWGGIELKYADRIETVNVATSSEYVTAFLMNQLGEMQLTALEASANPNDGADSNKKRSSSQMFACATVSGHTTSGVLWYLLMLPILLGLRFRK